MSNPSSALGRASRAQSSRPGILVALILLGVANSIAHAGTVYWDGDPANDGSWQTIANWSTDPAGGVDPAAAPGAADDVVFNANSVIATTLSTLGADQSARSITFGPSASSAITLGTVGDGFTLTLGSGGITVNSSGAAHTINSGIKVGAAQTWANNSADLFTVGGAVSLQAFTLTVGGAGDTVIGGAISGTGGLVKTGAGTLTLSGANTLSGAVSVNAGILGITAANNLGDGSATNTLTLDGGTLRNNGVSVDLGTTRSVAIGTSGGTFDVTTGNSLTVSGAITGSGAMTKSGAGNMTITAANAFSGPLIVTGGNLFLASTGGPALQSTSVTLGDGSADARLTLNASQQLPSNVILNFANGAKNAKFELNSNTQTVAQLTMSGTVAIIQNLETGGTGTGTLVVNSDTLDSSWSGYLRNQSGTLALTKQGTSTLTLSGANITYTGATTLSGGTLKLSDTTAFASAIANSAALVLDATAAWTLNPVISGNGSVTKTGSANVSLRGANTWNGGLTVNGGNINITATGQLGDPANAITLSGGGLQAGASVDTGNGRVITIGAGGGTLGSNTFTLTVSSPLSGAGTLTKAGAGTVILSADNSAFTGQIIVDSQTGSTAQSILRISNANAVKNAAKITINNTGDVSGGQGTLLDIMGPYTLDMPLVLASSPSNSNYRVSVQGTTPAGSALTLNGPITLTGVGGTQFYGTTGSTLVYNGNITSTGPGFVVRGAGTHIVNSLVSIGSATLSETDNATVILNTPGTWGNTQASYGTIRIGADNVLPATTSLIVGQGETSGSAQAGTFDLNGFDQTVGSITANVGTRGGIKSITNTSSRLCRFTVNTSGTPSYAAYMTGGALALAKSGTGTLTLSGANITFSGGATVNNGTLNLSNTSAFGSDIANSASLVLDATADWTLARNISGTGDVSTSGAAVVMLSGNNTFTGPTTIGAGTLRASEFAGLSYNSNLVLAGGTFQSNGILQRPLGTTGNSISWIAASPILSRGANLEISLGGSANPAALTWGVDGFVADGLNLILGSTDAATQTFWRNPIQLTSGGAATRTIQVDGQGYGMATISGAISDGPAVGSLTKTGLGTLVLSGVNSYTGATTVSAGTLRAAAGALPDSSMLVIDNGIFETDSDLTRTGGNVQIVGATAGLSAYGMRGPVTVTLSSLSWQTTDFNPGTLVLNDVTANQPLTFASSLDLISDVGAIRTIKVASPGAPATISGAIVDYAALPTAILQKTGAGTLILTGNNTFAGGVVLSEGTLQVANDGNLGSSYMTFNGGVLQWAPGTTVDYSSRISDIASGRAAILDTNGSNVVFATAMTGAGGLTKLGAGTLTLNGSSPQAYVGPTTANRGTLLVDFVNSFSFTDQVNANSALSLGGGTLEVKQASAQVTSQTFAGTTLTPGASIIKGTNVSGSGSATLTVNLGAITRQAGGTVAFTLPTAGQGSITTPTANNAYGTLGGWATIGDNWAVSAGNGSTPGVITALGTYTTQNSAASWAANQNITTSGAMTGTLASSITIGSLRIANNAASSTATLGSSTTLTVGSGGILVTSAVTSNTQTITGGTLRGTAGGDLIIVSNATLTGTTPSLNIASVIADNASATALTKSGAGSLRLSGTNTYTGKTFINQGILMAASDAALGAAPGSFVADQLTINGGALMNYSAALTIPASRGIYIGVNNARLGTGWSSAHNSNLMTINSVIAGPGSITTIADGNYSPIVLNGLNTYLGGTVISNNSLVQISRDENLGALGTNLSFNGGILRTTSALAMSRPVLMTGAGTLDSNGFDISLGGVLSGAGALTKTGDGTLFLAVPSPNFTGNVTLAQTTRGTTTNIINVQNSTALGSGTKTVSIANFTSEIQLQGGISIPAGVKFSLSNAGNYPDLQTVYSVGIGDVVVPLRNVGGSNTINGPIELTSGGGNSAVFSDSGLLTLAGNISSVAGDTRTLILGGASSGIISGKIQNGTSPSAIALAKIGSGTWSLSGDANTYTGGTTVHAGMLALDYSAQDNAKLGAGALAMSGGSMTLAGGTSAAETLTGTAVAPGASSIAITSGSTIVNLGAITRQAGGTMDFSPGAGAISTLTANSAGSILGGWATAGDTWAVSAGTGTVAGNITPLAVLDSQSWGAGKNTDLDSADLSAAGSTNSLRFSSAAPRALTLTADAVIDSGGILVTSGAADGQSIVGAFKLTSGNGQDLVITARKNLSIGSIIADNGTISIGVTKSGAGTLSLAGTNTYTGNTFVNAGVLDVAADANLGAGGLVAIGGGATLRISGAAGFVSSRNLTLKETATIDVQNADSVFLRGVIGDSGEGVSNLVKTGPGTLLVGNYNTYLGRTRIDAGTFSIGGDTSFGAEPPLFIADEVSLAAGATLQARGAFTLPATAGVRVGPASGSGSVTLSVTGNNILTVPSLAGASAATVNLVKSGTGLLVLSGANGYSGATSISAGVINIRNAGALGTGNASVTVDTGAALELEGGITVGANKFLSLAGAGPGGTGALRNISGNNTWAGNATLSAASTIKSDAGQFVVSGIVTGSNTDLTLGGLSADTTNLWNGAVQTRLAGQVNLGTGKVIKNDAGIWTLANADTYGGGTDVNAGILHIRNSLSLGTGAVNVARGGGLFFGPSGLSIENNITLNGLSPNLALSGGNDSGTISNTLRGNLVLAATSNIGTWWSDKTVTIAGTISGPGGLVIGKVLAANNAGNVIFSSPTANTYLGGTVVRDGTRLTVSNDIQLGAAAGGVTLTSGGQLVLGASAPIARNITLGTPAVSANAQAGVIDTAGFNSNFSGIISGSGGLQKSGTGTLTLSGANTYTGPTFVSAGTLTVSDFGALGSGPVWVNGGTFQWPSGNTTDISTLGRFVVGYSGAGYLDTNGQTITLAGSIDGVGKNGAGKLIVTGNVRSLNTITADGGTLEFSGSSTITTGQLTVAQTTSGAILDIKGNALVNVTGNYFLGNADGKAGTVNQSGGAVTIGGHVRVAHYPNNTSTYNMSGGSLVLTGTPPGNPAAGNENNGLGTIYLGIDGTGVLNHSGGDITAGAMVLDNRGNTTGTDTYAMTGGSLTLTSSWGIRTNLNSGIPNGSIAVNLGGGIIRTTASSSVITVPAALTGTNGNVTFDPAGTLTISGLLSGAGGLVKGGAGGLTLLPSVSNTYAGTTIAHGGALTLDFSNIVSATPTNVIAATGAPQLNGAALNITGHANATALTGRVGTTASGSALITASNTTGMVPGQAISGTGIPAGAVIATIIDGTSFLISANATAAGTGVALTLPASTFASQQTFAGLTINAGASAVNVNSNGAGGTTVNLKAITRNIGGTLAFTLPASGSITTTSGGAGAMLGGWATVGNDFAASTGAGPGFAISAYTGYTDQPDASLWSAGQNVTSSAAGISGTTPSSLSINTLRFAAAAPNGLTVADTLTIPGGILVSSTVGNNLSSISGGTLRGASGDDLVVIQNNAAYALSIDSSIADNSTATALTKSGAGTLVLAGSNAYSGTTYINAGALSVASDTALGGSNNIVIAPAGSLQAAETFTLGSARSIKLGQLVGAASGSIDVAAGKTLTYSGVLANNGGVGSLVKTGAGTLALGGANAYSGDTVINSGVLQVLDPATVPAGAGKGIVILNSQPANPGVLDLNGRSISINGLSGDNSNATSLGRVANNAPSTTATLTIGSNSALPLTFSGQIVDNTGTGGQLALTKAGSSTIILAVPASGSANAAYRNTYTGPTRITGGTLQVSWIDNGGLPSGIGASSSAASNLVIDGGNFQWNNLNGTASTDRLFTVGAAGATLTANNGSNPVSFTNAGDLATDGAGNRNLTLDGSSTQLNIFAPRIVNPVAGATTLVKTGAGLWILTNANAHTGGTIVNQGTLRLANPAGPALPGDVDVRSGNAGSALVELGASNQIPATANVNFIMGNTAGNWAYLKLMGFNQSLATINDPFGRGVIENFEAETTVNTGATLTLNSSSDSVFAGYIRDKSAGANPTAPLAIVKDGTGSLRLSGPQIIYTGGTTIKRGGVLLDAFTPNFTGPLIFNVPASGTGTFRFNDNDITLTGLSTDPAHAGAAIVENGSDTDRTLKVNLASGISNTFAGTLRDNAGGALGLTRLYKTGAGALTLAGTNAYSGGTLADGGLLLFNSALPPSGAILSSGAGYIGAASPAWGANLNNFLSRFDKANSGGVIGVESTTADAIDLTGFNRNARLHTSTAATFSGLVTPQNGIYRLGGGGGVLTIASDLADGGSNVRGLDLGNNGFATGVVVLAGNNSYTGPTLVNSGTLRLASASAMPPNSNLRLNGGVVELAFADFTRALGPGGDQVQFLSGGGFAALGANRSVNFGGNTTPSQVAWAGAWAWPGTLTLGSTSADATVNLKNPIDLNGADRTISVNDGLAPIDAEMSGAVSGANGITKTGAGALALSAANTYTGTTTVNAGTLAVSAENNLGAVAAKVLFNNSAGSTLRITENITTARIHSATGSGWVGIFDIDENKTYKLTAGGGLDCYSGSAGFIKNGLGTLVIAGNDAQYDSNLRINSGSVAIETVGAIGDGTSAGQTADVNLYGGNFTVRNDANTNFWFEPVVRASASITIDRLTAAPGNITHGAYSTGTTKSWLQVVSGGTPVNLAIQPGPNMQPGSTATLETGWLRMVDTTNLDVAAGAALSVASASGASLNKSGAGTLAVNGLFNAGSTTLTGGSMKLASGSIGPIASSANLEFAPAVDTTVNVSLSGAGSFTKSGSATLTLIANSSYTGATNITGGTLKLGGPIPSVPPSAAAHFTFDAGTVSGNNVTNIGTLSAKNATLNGASGVTTGNGGLSGEALTLGGNDAVMLIDPSGTTKGIDVSSGNWTASAWFNGLYANTENSGGWRTLFRGSTTDHHIILENNANNRVGTYVSSGFRTIGTDFSFDGVMSGWHQVTAVGSVASNNTSFYIDGVLLGSAAYRNATDIYSVGNHFTGSLGNGQPFARKIDEVYIYQSALSPDQVLALYRATSGITATDFIPDLSPVVLTNASVLDLNGANETIGSLAGETGTAVNLNGGNLTAGGDNSSTTFSGAIGGASGNLIKQGGGAFTLGGVNTYAGNTSVSAGALIAASTGSLPGYDSGRISVASGATLAVRSGGVGEWTSGDLDTLTGAAGAVFNTGANVGIEVTTGNTFTYAGSLAGATPSKGFVKLGAGNLVLSSSQSYTGPTSVAAGILTANASIASPVVVASGAVFEAVPVGGTSAAPVAIAVSGLSLGAGASDAAKARITSAAIGGSVLMTPALSLVGTGSQLDVTSNGVVLNYDGSIPGESALRNGQVRQWIRDARATGDWSGARGITSSLITPVTATDFAVGYRDSSAISPTGGTFMGQAVDGSAVLVRYTVLGDSNLDGVVNFIDLVAVAQNYNTTGTGIWQIGDFNYDNDVNFIDLVAVAQHYNQALPTGASIPGASADFQADWQNALAIVPEPGTLGLLAIGTLLLIRRRRAA